MKRNYSTSLRQDVINWSEEIGELDILVGVPCFNQEDTIRNVVETIAEGLAAYYPDMRKAIFVSDGGSLDDTRENALLAVVPENVHRKVAIYRGLPGKGTSLRAVFELVEKNRAEACAVVDSDLRSITPDWIEKLTRPILDGKADYVSPYYLRHKFDATITNHIVYPLTRSLYGKNVRQPIGGDFGFSGTLASFYAHQDVWHTDVAKFGIDIWMTTCAVNEGFRIVQAKLGTKIHNSKDPAVDLGPMFQQVVSTLFYLMGQYESKWLKIHETEEIPVYGELDTSPQIPPVAVTLSKMEDEFTDGFEQFRPLYEMILSAENFMELIRCYQQKKAGRELDLPAGLWARILYDFGLTFQSWRRNRRRLVDMITPLYFGRAGSFCREAWDMDNEEAEKVILKQAEIFEKSKDYLIHHHDTIE